MRLVVAIRPIDPTAHVGDVIAVRRRLSDSQALPPLTRAHPLLVEVEVGELKVHYALVRVRVGVGVRVRVRVRGRGRDRARGRGRARARVKVRGRGTGTGRARVTHPSVGGD